jgi:cytochrome c
MQKSLFNPYNEIAAIVSAKDVDIVASLSNRAAVFYRPWIIIRTAAYVAIVLLGITSLQSVAPNSAQASAAASKQTQSPTVFASQCPNVAYGIHCAAGYHAVAGGIDANGCSLPPRCAPSTTSPQSTRPSSHSTQHPRIQRQPRLWRRGRPRWGARRFTGVRGAGMPGGPSTSRILVFQPGQKRPTILGTLVFWGNAGSHVTHEENVGVCGANNCGGMVFLITACSALGQEDNTADDVGKGHRLAAVLCAICHVAASDQRFAPTLNPPAPSFGSIAQRKDANADSLQNFMSKKHPSSDNPRSYLTNDQVRQVVAYLLSLRK